MGPKIRFKFVRYIYNKLDRYELLKHRNTKFLFVNIESSNLIIVTVHSTEPEARCGKSQMTVIFVLDDVTTQIKNCFITSF